MLSMIIRVRSRPSGGGVWMFVAPSHDEKSSGWRETCFRSSYFVTHQKPGPSASGCQCTGSCARSARNQA